MKTKFFAWFRTGWRVLTEVPGWPDAPVWMRMQRAMPVLIPCTAMVLLLDWNLLFLAPAVREQELALSPLVALEKEVTFLRLSGSDDQLAQFSERAKKAHDLVLNGAAALPGYLDELKAAAQAAGWNTQFVIGDTETNTPASSDLIHFLPVRAKLNPLATNEDVFASFVSLVEGFSSARKRIDLIRLSIRADDQRWQSVELNLRCISTP